MLPPGNDTSAITAKAANANARSNNVVRGSDDAS
jgi:hypothetical protein